MKAHLLRDRELYLHEFVGGYIFTDYLVNRLGWSIDKWHFGSSAKKGHLEKLRVGWSYGISRRNRALAYISSLFPYAVAIAEVRRELEILSVERDNIEWYEQYRGIASKSVEQLKVRSGFPRTNEWDTNAICLS